MPRKFHVNNISSETLNKERKRAIKCILAIVRKDQLIEVGSTAIAGIIGKQDLDFLVRVKSDDFESVRKALDHSFRRKPDQISNDEYQGYIVDSELDIAIQLTIEGGKHDDTA